LNTGYTHTKFPSADQWLLSPSSRWQCSPGNCLCISS
jgi:hypothetical protein